LKKGTITYALFILLFSMGVLASEIILTRIFSVIFWYHFGFLILSSAMLGFGIGGVLIRLYGVKLERYTQPHIMVTASLLSGLALVTALVIITHNPFYSSDPGQSPGTMALYMGLEIFTGAMALVFPFTMMGAVIIHILQRNKEHVAFYYAANLAGSGLGCLWALFLLDNGGGLTGLLSVAALLIASGALLAWPDLKKLAGISMIASLVIVLLLPYANLIFPLKSPQGKPATRIRDDRIKLSEWTSLSKVDFFEETNADDHGFGLWGLSSEFKGNLPERMGILIDYWAYTTMLRHKDTPGYYDFMDDLPMNAMYSITKDNPNMLIIGSGGGMDIRSGLIHGARHIDAVEINPSIFKGLTRTFADYSGGVYQDPRVNAHLAEGRRFLESSRDHYDLIQLSGVDTCSSTQAGAFALSENFLYTREAFNQFYNHLTPQGLLSLTHWFIPSAKGYPRFSLRLFCLALSALEDQGIKSPEKNILFFQSKRFAILLAKQHPFSPEEIKTIADIADQKGYSFLYRPDKVIFTAMKFYSYVKARDKEAWINDYPYQVSPPTDDSPFYFENRKLKNIFSSGDYISGYSRFDGQTILVLLLGEMILASLILIIFSFRLEKNRPDIPGWLYFFCIGMGFMLVEVSFSQQLILFLGHPFYALSVVLFSILMFSGIGSFVSERLSTRVPGSALLLILSLLLVVQSLFGLHLIRSLMGIQSNMVRIMISVVLIAFPAFFMGTAFPLGVSQLNRAGKHESLGIYWAWNSVASVTAAIIAILMAIEYGFHTVMITAALCYLISACLFPRLNKP